MIEVNARRLLCPMPVIRLQDAIESIADNEQVQIICTDPGVLNDIPAWSRINGHKIIDSKQDDDEYIFVVQKIAETPLT